MVCLSNRNTASNIRALAVSLQTLKIKDHRFIFISVHHISIFSDYIESLPHANTPEVFGLHPNAEIGYYTSAARDMWSHLVELQPQTGDSGSGISREEFIGKIAKDVLAKLPPEYEMDKIRKKYGLDIPPTTVVLLQELERFNNLIIRMRRSLQTLQKVRDISEICFKHVRVNLAPWFIYEILCRITGILIYICTWLQKWQEEQDNPVSTMHNVMVVN